MKARSSIILLTLMAALAGCSQGAVSISSEPDDALQIETQAQQSPAATDIPASTATPTPDLPLKIGTSLPVSMTALDNENVESIQEIGVAQNGYRITRMTSDRKNVYIADRSGISLCEMAIESPQIPSEAGTFSTEKIKTIVPCKKIIYHWDIFLRLNENQIFSPADFVITPSGSHFLVVTDNDIQIYDRGGNLVNALSIPETDFKAELSVDGKYAALTYSGKVHIIDIQDEQTAFEDDGTNAEFSPDGKFVAVQKRMAVYLYSTSDWSKIYEFPQDSGSGWAISGNGQWIANYVGNDVVIHNLVDGEHSRTIKDLTYRYLSETNTRYTKFVPDYLVISNEGEYLIGITVMSTVSEEYHTSIAQPMEEIQGKIIGVITDLDSNALNQVVDVANVAVDDQFNIYYLGTEKPWKYLAETQRFYFTKEGNTLLYSAYADDPYERSNELCTLTSSLDVVCQSKNIQIDSEGNILAKDTFGTAWVKVEIDPNASNTGMLIKSFKDLGISVNEDAHMTSYYVKVLNQKHNSFIGSYKGEDRVVNMETGEILRTWKIGINNPVVSPDSDYASFLYSDLAVGGFSRVGYYDFKNNKFQLLHYETRPSSFAFCNQSERLIGIENESTQDGLDKIVAYSLTSEDAMIPETVAEFAYLNQPEIGRLNTLAISPDDSLIIAGTDKGYLLAFDPEDGSLIHYWQAHENASVLAAAFSLDGTNFYSSSEYGEIKVWGSQPFEWDSIAE